MVADLTPKQERFARLVFEGLPQRQAYTEAGYSRRQPLAVIDRNASVLANSTKVVMRLEELRKAAEDSTIANVKERMQYLTKYVRSNITDYIDAEGNIKLDTNPEALAELVIEDWQGGVGGRAHSRTKRIKLHSPLQAIDILNKMDRIYSEMSASYQDNRTINIIVSSEKAKELTENAYNRFKEIEAERKRQED